MKIPKKMTEKEVISIINDVVNRLARRFIFGYHDVEDIKQQGRLFAVESLENYDNKRPLENFLWTHVKNRLCNYKRDKYERPYISCSKCKYQIEDTGLCKKYENIEECEIYSRWKKRNGAKKNLMSPIELDCVQSEHEVGMSIVDNQHEEAVHNELEEIIDKNIPLILRADYIRIKNGVKISKLHRDKVRECVKQILIDNGYIEGETTS
jgi:DNA-directed RNA polymerase specialized sigma24 family protein